MRVKCICYIPTHHQVRTMTKLCGQFPTKNPDGSFEFSREFDTKREAKQWMLFQANEIKDEDNLYVNMYKEVMEYSTLTYDTISIVIKKSAR